MLRPGRIASPAPARAFTFELSPPESPHEGVEYHHAGKSANSRGRTCTGRTSSIMGCKLRSWRCSVLRVSSSQSTLSPFLEKFSRGARFCSSLFHAAGHTPQPPARQLVFRESLLFLP